MHLSSIIAHAEDLGEDDALFLAHGLARNGLADGLRVLGLMGKLNARVDGAGVDLLGWAARGGDESSLLLAGEFCGAGERDSWGGSALHHWAELKSEAAGAGAQILLTFGADPTSRDNWGLLPMHWSRDPGVWAWSMGALWGKGDPNGWMTCKGVSYQEVSKRMNNPEFVAWVERSKSARRIFMGAPRVDPASEMGWDTGWLGQMSERSSVLKQLEEIQNCIAKKLGIELMGQSI
jgi:hypothetical protein